MTRTIVLCNREITYELNRKRVKNLNIRIRTDGSVSVSANSRVSVKEIERFMQEKAECIVNAIDKYTLQKAKEKITFTSGEKLTLLGTSYTLHITKADKNFVTESGGIITVGVTDTENKALIEKVFGKWLKEHSYEYGFILRYPKGKEYITGIEFEPWHFRYVGVPAATYMTENELTLEELWEEY